MMGFVIIGSVIGIREERNMKIYILDRKRSTTRYAELYFYGLDNVEVVNAEFEDFMRNNPVECVVSPANAYGLMDGGYDWAITRYFGEQLPKRVQRYILEHLYGEQPVGTSIIVDAGKNGQRLIHTPTMRIPEPIKDPCVIYHCMRSTLMCAYQNNVQSIVIPFFGGGCGDIHPNIVAKMMWKAYTQIHNPPSELDWNYAYSQEISC